MISSPSPQTSLRAAGGESLQDWLSLAFSGPVRRRALRFVVVVGAILITINHGDALLQGDVDGPRFARILLTLAVPYVVSTVSSVAAIREMRKKEGA